MPIAGAFVLSAAAAPAPSSTPEVDALGNSLSRIAISPWLPGTGDTDPMQMLSPPVGWVDSVDGIIGWCGEGQKMIFTCAGRTGKSVLLNFMCEHVSKNTELKQYLEHRRPCIAPSKKKHPVVFVTLTAEAVAHASTNPEEFEEEHSEAVVSLVHKVARRLRVTEEPSVDSSFAALLEGARVQHAGDPQYSDHVVILIDKPTTA